MPTMLQDLAQLVQGELHGDPHLVISDAATIANANSQDITLAENDRFIDQLAHSSAAAVVIPNTVDPPSIPCIRVSDVLAAFGVIVRHLRKPVESKNVGISPEAQISDSARISDNVNIFPGAFIGDDVEIGSRSVIHSGVRILDGTKLGEEVIIYPNAVLYENTIVHDRVVIQGGAVIGGFGFGYQTVEGRHELSAQLGYVEIESDVDIGAGTTIDRGTYDATVIGEGTKIDNQVMIAHNCRIGRHNLICSQVGIAGSVVTGDYAVFAGQVGVKDHVRIGSQTTFYAKAGVMTDVPDNEVFAGIPALPFKIQSRVLVALPRLPELRRQIRKIEHSLAQIQSQLKDKLSNEAAQL